MTGHIVDYLAGALIPTGHATEAIQKLLPAYRGPGSIPRCGAVKNRAPQGVTDGVVEESKLRQLIGIFLSGKADSRLCQYGGHIPALPIENNMGVFFANCGDDLLYGLHIKQTGNIKAESIQMVFIRPEVHGIDNEFAHHSPL